VVVVMVLFDVIAVSWVYAARHHLRVPQRWRLGTARCVLPRLAGPPPYIAATITVTSYILYSIDPLVIKSLHTDKLMYTSLFVIIGVFRFIQISEGKEYDGEGDPTTILYKDRFTQIIIACWLTSVYLLLYVG
jgi:hypothetical protein